MNSKIINPPAFPVESFNQQSKGMSKRYFTACMAMQGILSANPKGTWGNIDIPVPQYVAELSYKYADELIKQEFNTEE